MNNKYFGNSLDLFKYSLITKLAGQDVHCLYYLGMVTEPQLKVIDPKYKIYEVGNSDIKLTSFLQSKFDNQGINQIRSLNQIFDYHNLDYCSITEYADESKQHDRSANLGYFEDSSREEYFSYILKKLKRDQRNKFVFVDPDIGSTIGISRRIRNNRSAYLKIEELQKLLTITDDNSYLGYFQHLGNTNYRLADRHEDLRKQFGDYVILSGYERTQAGIVFIFKNEYDYLDKRKKINEFILEHDHIEHKDKLFIL